MKQRDWLSVVAVHTDSWLLAVAFYYGARLNHTDRKRLYSLINDLPTAYEVVTEREPTKDKLNVDNGSKPKFNTKRTNDGHSKSNAKQHKETYEEDEDENGDTVCGSCGGNYVGVEFWIRCDMCERWYHGKCVKITPAKAESIKQYKCPSCSSKKSRQEVRK